MKQISASTLERTRINENDRTKLFGHDSTKRTKYRQVFCPDPCPGEDWHSRLCPYHWPLFLCTHTILLDQETHTNTKIHHAHIHHPVSVSVFLSFEEVVVQLDSAYREHAPVLSFLLLNQASNSGWVMSSRQLAHVPS
ncbi:hypothetical protein M0802_016982 [Mischocyttarus mexicanus]|nr:hypothetical protein M0802_016982 [Mischocyttarus mexicanus]